MSMSMLNVNLYALML